MMVKWIVLVALVGCGGSSGEGLTESTPVEATDAGAVPAPDARAEASVVMPAPPPPADVDADTDLPDAALVSGVCTAPMWTGTCDAGCTASFSGSCGGNCTGTCDGNLMSGGACMGKCVGTCDANASGSCSAVCTGVLTAASCSGEWLDGGMPVAVTCITSAGPRTCNPYLQQTQVQFFLSVGDAGATQPTQCDQDLSTSTTVPCPHGAACTAYEGTSSWSGTCE